MSEKIGRRPPTGPMDPRRLSENTPSAPAKHAPEASGAKELTAPDTFERPQGPGVGAQLKTHLQALAKGASQTRVVFSNEDLAYLANTFAALIRQHPKANRAKRAKLFGKAILQGHKRLGKLLEQAPKEEAEALFDAVADALDGSPVFAQLVENVTDEASKLNG